MGRSANELSMLLPTDWITCPSRRRNAGTTWRAQLPGRAGADWSWQTGASAFGVWVFTQYAVVGSCNTRAARNDDGRFVDREIGMSTKGVFP